MPFLELVLLPGKLQQNLEMQPMGRVPGNYVSFVSDFRYEDPGVLSATQAQKLHLSLCSVRLLLSPSARCLILSCLPNSVC